MRIALAQINPVVGDISGNCRKAVSFIDRAKNNGADLIVFPELSVIGYPPKDLLLKPRFIDDNIAGVKFIAERVKGIDAVVGYAERNHDPVGRPLHNAVALLRDGKIVSRHFKTLLPTYDVFDESRYFEPGAINEKENLVKVGRAEAGIDATLNAQRKPTGPIIAGLSICEDLWNDERLIPRRLYHRNPIADLHYAGAQIMINTSASPFVVGKHDFRLKLFSSQVKQYGQPLVYVNQVGGNDELVFDGNSVVFDSTGNVIAQAKDFEEDLLLVDVPVGGTTGIGGPIHRATAGIESIYRALVLGLRDYMAKCGFKTAVVGLSGGIDSAVTAALAVAALGAEKIVGVAMPSRFSSSHSVEDARLLAANLGIAFHVVPIEEVHGAYERTLAESFAGRAADVTEENLQARIRGALLMAFSNKFNHLLLTTGNKSEIAVGYCTLYGDMCGGLAVISDVPKTAIWELAKWINQHAGKELIPRRSIEKVPSAELRPNQTDQDSLPAYEILDAILFRYIEEEKGAAEIIADGFDADTVRRVIRLVDRSEYKRRQMAPGIKVTSRASASEEECQSPRDMSKAEFEVSPYPTNMSDNPAPETKLLKAAYAAFNARNIDAALAMMTPDVSWPKAFKGGFVCGHQAVRAYWTEQWSEMDPHVEPVSFYSQDDGCILVDVHQVVRDLAGTVLADVHVGHRFTLANGLIQAMEVSSLPSPGHGT